MKPRRANFFHLMLALIASLTFLFVLVWHVAGLLEAMVLSGIAALWVLLVPGRLVRTALCRYGARPVTSGEAPLILGELSQLSMRAGLPQSPLLWRIADDDCVVFAIGGFGRATVAISDGVLKSLNLPELRAVLAHELAHVGHLDCAVASVAEVLKWFLLGVLALIGGYVVFLTIAMPVLSLPDIGYVPPAFLAVAVFSSVSMRWFSRRRELAADQQAVRLTGDSEALMSALQKLGAMQMRRGTVGAVIEGGGASRLVELRLASLLSMQVLSPLSLSGSCGMVGEKLGEVDSLLDLNRELDRLVGETPAAD